MTKVDPLKTSKHFFMVKRFIDTKCIKFLQAIDVQYNFLKIGATTIENFIFSLTNFSITRQGE